ncbi:hypothetical protein [Variovorax sp. dw_308]|uniref:hypothetical protein n=1 Tax=Variovorax sp. dw_308 TaxID=2721546 RepID=UPI001C44BBB3|nr:hypothetical protein [Variovorax sp. dw_308]
MFITATAMVCPVGLNAVSACAAKRAGISAFANLPFSDDAGEPVVGASVPGLALSLPRAERLVRMLAKGMADLLRGQTNLNWSLVPLLVCLAEPQTPGGGSDLASRIVDKIETVLGIRFHSENSRVFVAGHVGGMQALLQARHLIERGQAPACVVCGVDSLINATTLLWLDQTYRLKTPGNRDGVVPGEAAAALLIGAAPAPDTVMKVTGLGFGQEDAPVLSDGPLLGKGLTAAVRAALAEARVGLHEIDLRLSDVTGELYGFKELPLMEGRLMRTVRKKAQPVWHWAEAIGDTGAAAGIAQLVLADQAFRKGYLDGERALCLTSSVMGGRAATIVHDIRA